MLTFKEYCLWREELWNTSGPAAPHDGKRWGKDAHPDEYNHQYGAAGGGGGAMGAMPMPAQGGKQPPAMPPPKKMKKMKSEGYWREMGDDGIAYHSTGSGQLGIDNEPVFKRKNKFGKFKPWELNRGAEKSGANINAPITNYI